MPDEPTPTKHRHRAVGSQLPLYNMTTFGDLFTGRQKVALVEFGSWTASLPEGIPKYLIALLLGRMADGNNSLARWESGAENPVNLFARQAIPMVWDFCESTPKSNARGVFLSGINAACEVIEYSRSMAPGQLQLADATAHPLPSQSTGVWFTDPPYYDAIPYADLSDFFLVWLKRTLPDNPLLVDPYDQGNSLTPKVKEIVVDSTTSVEHGPRTPHFYERAMETAFTEGRRVLQDDGVGSVVFAHKSTEGWEALLSGMIRGGWTITGSWPIATESTSRLNARDTASLATSVHLICRPRPSDVTIGDWAVVLSELPGRVGNWMQRLDREGVRGADLVFACVGPALEIFSRYSRVETAEGREVALPEYLEKVWEVVGREALQQILGTAEAQARNGAAGALEEDARLTALFLWTLQSTSDSASPEDGDEPEDDEVDNEDEEAPQRRASGYSLPFDVVRRFSQPLGIHLDDWRGRVIETNKGVVRLTPVMERGRQLFGESGADAMADEYDIGAASSPQLSLFPEEPPSVRGRTRRRDRGTSASLDDPETRRDATTLDRVHAAMLLQASGRSQALRNLLRAEQERGPDFLRLANALSALYPRGSEEKRLLDAMLLAAPR